jgi:hypothetical protein
MRPVFGGKLEKTSRSFGKQITTLSHLGVYFSAKALMAKSACGGKTAVEYGTFFNATARQVVIMVRNRVLDGVREERRATTPPHSTHANSSSRSLPINATFENSFGRVCRTAAVRHGWLTS